MAGDVDVSVALKLLGSETLQKSLDSAADKADKLGKGFESIRNKAAVALTGIGVAVGGAIKSFTDFEAKFTDTLVLLDKKTAFGSLENFDKGANDLKKTMLEMRSATGQSFDALLGGLAELTSSGFEGEKALTGLKDATDLAAAGSTTADIAVKALVASISAYKEQAGSTREVAEKFFVANNYGITSIAELAGEFNKVAGQANSLGVSFNEMLAATAALTNDGAKPTSEAFTQLKSALNGVIGAQGRLSEYSPAVQKALSLENVRRKGLVTALRETWKATGQNVVSMQKLLGSEEALAASTALTGGQMAKYDEILKALGNSTERAATFQNAVDIKFKTSKATMDRFLGSLEVISVQMGDIFAPSLNAALEPLTAFLKGFQALPEETQRFIADLVLLAGALAAAAVVIGVVGQAITWLVAGMSVLAPVLTVIGAVFAAVFSPIGLIIAGIIAAVVALGAAIYYLVTEWETVSAALSLGFDTLKEIVSMAATDISAAWGEAMTWLGEATDTAGQSMSSYLSSSWESIKAGGRSLQTFLAGIWDAMPAPVKAVADAIKGWLVSAFDGIVEKAQWVYDKVASLMSALADRIRNARSGGGDSGGGDSWGGQAFASGGLVSGPGTGTSDSIDAKLSNGEFVMRAAAVGREGVGIMQAINDGRLRVSDLIDSMMPRFADGGLVTAPAFASPQIPQGTLSEIGGGGGRTNRLELMMPDGTMLQGEQTDSQARATRSAALRSKRRRPHGAPSWER